jgi:hypothetical protein
MAGTGIPRVEQVGPILLNRLYRLLGDDCKISLKPVIDLPAGHTPVDACEIPAGSRSCYAIRPMCFPYAPAVSRQIDIDRTIPTCTPTTAGHRGRP